MMNRKHYLHILGTAVVAALCSITNNFSGGVGAAEALSASDAPEFELAGITVEAKRPDWESKLSPGTVTVIRPEEYKGEQKDLPDLLKMVPGVHVREVNGKGQYTVVTVRGSTAAQVGVFVDGVMTNLGGDAAVDISTIPVKNVERIEVYRGYIPARFGGTFIGGVINVVTKKPTKANISAELGKASFGGKSASLEVVSPLASGSLLVGLNYEAAKGDFPYKNYAYNEENQQNIQSSVTFKQKEVDELKSSLDINNWNRKNIESLYNDDEIPKNVRDQYIDSSGQVDSGAWLDFVRSGGLIQAEIEYVKEKARAESTVSTSWDNKYVEGNEAFLKDAANWYMKNNAKFADRVARYHRNVEKLGKRYKDNPTTLAAKIKRQDESLKADLLDLYLKTDWENANGPDGYFKNNPEAKSQVDNKIYEEVDKKTNTEIEKIKNTYTPDRLKDRFDPSGENYKKKENDLKVSQRDLKEYQELEKAKAERHRKYNDRKNVSSLIKWQNDNWMVKASYNHINRHLPDPLWGEKK